jgi:hypothetical protein
MSMVLSKMERRADLKQGKENVSSEKFFPPGGLNPQSLVQFLISIHTAGSPCSLICPLKMMSSVR